MMEKTPPRAAAERDERVERLNRTVAERDERIERLNRTVAERRERIEELRTAPHAPITPPGKDSARPSLLSRRYCAASRTELAERTVDAAENGGKIPILFDPAFYLDSNEDVRSSGVDPLEHYLGWGAIEGRMPIGDVRPGALHPLVRDLHRLGPTGDKAFALDCAFYRSLYPDLASFDDEALAEHYENYGRAESRVNSAYAFVSRLCDNPREIPLDFDPDEYVDLYSQDLEVYCKGQPLRALHHYMHRGRWEPRYYTLRALRAESPPTGDSSGAAVRERRDEGPSHALRPGSGKAGLRRTRCVLHAGFGKTGSTSLQEYLVQHPELPTADRHRYVVINHRGEVMDGQRTGTNSPSSTTPFLWKLDNLESIGERLVEVAERGIPVISQEQFTRDANRFLKRKVLRRLNAQMQVVVYVRPQIEWFNSGWWQWWEWIDTFRTPSDIVRKWGYGFLRWREQIDWWLKNPDVDQVIVRLYRGNTISDFLDVLGATGQPDTSHSRENPTLSFLYIKILKMFPDLREPNLSGVRFERYKKFIREHIPSAGEGAPWILTTEDMQLVVDHCREDNKRLMELLSPADAEAMERDQRWWSIESYRDRPLATDDDFVMTPEESETCLKAALRMSCEEKS